MTIYLGTILGGPELQEKGLDRLVSLAERATGTAETTPALDVVFIVPGSIMRTTEFDGLRLAKFSKAEKTLMIQVAVPHAMVNAPEKRIAGFIASSLREAVALAKPKFEKAKLKYPEEKLLGVVAEIAKAIGA